MTAIMPDNLHILPLPEGMTRMESGPVQFGKDDWPGVFIRGDHALHFSWVLTQMLDSGVIPKDDWVTLSVLRGLAKSLLACNVMSQDG